MKKWIIILGVLVGLIILLLIQSYDWNIRHRESGLSTYVDGVKSRGSHTSSVRNALSGILHLLESLDQKKEQVTLLFFFSLIKPLHGGRDHQHHYRRL